MNLYSDEIYIQMTKKDPFFCGCELEEYFIEKDLSQHYSMIELGEIVMKKIDIHF